MTRLGVVGANGRMGRALVRLAPEMGFELVAAIADAGGAGGDAGTLAGVGPLGVTLVADPGVLRAAKAEVVIDFSAPSGTSAACAACAASGIALVSGTTGIDARARAALDQAAETCAVLWAPNMSVGVHVLAMLVKQAARALGAEYDVEVVEVHHRAKVDAPSGTALRLAEAAREGRAGLAAVHGREGRPGPRRPEELGVFAVRGGDVIGDHTLHFLGDGERLELTHRATSRDLFARGALRAARWLVGRPPGRYDLADVLRA